jgi:hypothetical protein
MRRILLVTLVAAGVGFVVAPPGASAMPIGGAAIRDAAVATDQVTQVGWHSRWRSHWRWGSRWHRRWWR